jgi:hypothetical protein
VTALDQAAKAVLRGAGVTPATWARANYSTDGTWSGDACGCPDSRCKDGFHHSPQQKCGCLEALLESYVSGEGQFDGESGYVIRDPLWAQVRLARRRAGLHSGRRPSALLRALTALDEILKRHPVGEQDGCRSCDVTAIGCAERRGIARALLGEESASG